MEDGAPNAMNLNLNLGLNDNSSNDAEPEVGSFTHEALNSEYWLGDPISGISNAVRPRQRRREPWRPLWRQLQVSPGARNSALGLNDGEGSIASEENKTCDKNDVFLDDELLGKEKGDEKGNYDTGSFFDCNICLDLASDPVVTCCGHLFCWTCIYKWLHFHSDAKECPVCKGEVSLKNVTPIYGRCESIIRQPIDDINLKVPNRPQAQRVESWRQVMQRSEFNVQMEEVVLRRLVNRRLYRSRAQSQHDDAPRESAERSNLQPNHIQAYRAVRRERNPEISHENVFDDLTQRRSPANSEAGESSQIPSAYYQRMNSNLAVVLSNLSTLGSADRVVESYLPNDTLERNQEPTQAVGDRDSMSSIAAVIQSESQTVDTPFDNDSTVLLSTSSSRRRNNASRISDVNSGDSRAPRRRRLN